MPRPSKEHTESWSFELDRDSSDEKGIDLDYVPTREQPVNLDELYAKVDKSGARSSLDGVFPRMTEDRVDGNMADSKHMLERTMSDIVEDKEAAVPDVDREDIDGVRDMADADDSDDYTELDEIINERKSIQNIKVYIEKQGKSLGKFLEANSSESYFVANLKHLFDFQCYIEL